MAVRKNQNQLDPAEWQALIGAMEGIHAFSGPSPRYMDFVKVHVRAMDMNDAGGMSWHVHSMNGSDGFNFLSWHRRFLFDLEARLQQIDPNIALPYWDATTDRTIPQALADPDLLHRWRIRRGVWDPSQLASPQEETDILQVPTFELFQSTLEDFIHGGVHMAVGGDMAGPASPTDPLFFLHHANIDRLWAAWQGDVAHQGRGPSNINEVLQPPPLFGVPVSAVQDIAQLNYSYL
jgi:tyrosinase